MGDVIPAGQGMKDVQLLVVDRESLAKEKPRLCNVGEQGEIYVRAGGLSEGYLSSDKLNADKFLPNFFLPDPDVWAKADERRAQELSEPWENFWKGPRDRLYRSGGMSFPLCLDFWKQRRKFYKGCRHYISQDMSHPRETFSSSRHIF